MKGERGPPMCQRDTRCGAAAEPGNLCKHVLVLYNLLARANNASVRTSIDRLSEGRFASDLTGM